MWEKQGWPWISKKSWPNPLPKKRNVKKFGDNQEENDLRWTGDINVLTQCNGCGLKVSEGWADSRVDQKIGTVSGVGDNIILEGCPDKPSVVPIELV